MENPPKKDTQQPAVWNYGDDFRYRPGEGDPWQECKKFVEEHDKDMCKSWEDEISNLLIFAGLFTAIVSAFTVESYQWFYGDPQEDMTQLLSQLVSIQSENQTTPYSSGPLFSQPRSSVVRINVCWFLSISLSLSSSFLGLLTMQWIREFRLHTSVSPRDALKLRQLRYRSLEAWRIPVIMTALPMILEISVLLFFAGLLDLVWQLDRAVAICTSTVVGLTVLFTVFTTFSPVFYYAFLFNWRLKKVKDEGHNLHPCPYKSPQAWFVLQGFAVLLLGWRLLVTWASDIGTLCDTEAQKENPKIRREKHFSKFKSQEWIAFEQQVLAKDTLRPSRSFNPTYMQRALRWIHDTMRSRKTMSINVFRCLDSLDDRSDNLTIQYVLNHSHFGHMEGHGVRAEMLYYRFFNTDISEPSKGEVFPLELLCHIVLGETKSAPDMWNKKKVALTKFHDDLSDLVPIDPIKDDPAHPGISVMESITCYAVRQFAYRSTFVTMPLDFSPLDKKHGFHGHHETMYQMATILADISDQSPTMVTSRMLAATYIILFQGYLMQPPLSYVTEALDRLQSKTIVALEHRTLLGEWSNEPRTLTDFIMCSHLYGVLDTTIPVNMKTFFVKLDWLLDVLKIDASHFAANPSRIQVIEGDVGRSWETFQKSLGGIAFKSRKICDLAEDILKKHLSEQVNGKIPSRRSSSRSSQPSRQSDPEQSLLPSTAPEGLHEVNFGPIVVRSLRKYLRAVLPETVYMLPDGASWVVTPTANGTFFRIRLPSEGEARAFVEMWKTEAPKKGLDMVEASMI